MAGDEFAAQKPRQGRFARSRTVVAPSFTAAPLGLDL